MIYDIESKPNASIEQSGPPSQANLNILLIDDDSAWRQSLRAMLEQMGHRVHEAPNGVKGATLFNALRGEIDLILLDYLMPEMDGAQTLAHLRRIYPEVKIILLSGAEELRIRQVFDRRQVDGYLHKPVMMSQLAQIMAAAMTPSCRMAW
jgi:two-component system cell cycle sensor histidine kinase/response regulator CckA